MEVVSLLELLPLLVPLLKMPHPWQEIYLTWEHLVQLPWAALLQSSLASSGLPWQVLLLLELWWAAQPPCLPDVTAQLTHRCAQAVGSSGVGPAPPACRPCSALHPAASCRAPPAVLQAAHQVVPAPAVAAAAIHQQLPPPPPRLSQSRRCSLPAGINTSNR